MEVVNLTAAQYLHRAATMPSTEPSKNNMLQKQNKTITSIPPFTDSIAPLIQKIQHSFASTGKLLGSSSFPKDAGPNSATLMLATTQKLQTELVLPLHELHDVTHAHKKAIFLMYQSQLKELKTLQSMMEQVKLNHERSIQKCKAVETNANELSQRSAAILEASRSIHPKLSQAEYEYFTQLKRWELQTNKWNERLEKIQHRVKTMTTTTTENHQEHILQGHPHYDEPQCCLNLSEEQAHTCGDLLRGQGVLLKKSKAILSNVEREARYLMERRGLIMEQDNFIRDA